MKAFEIYVNGRLLVTVGMDDNVLVVHSILEIHGGILNHIVRGYGKEGEWFDWPGPQPKVGDEITIKIIETDRVAPWEQWHLPRKPPST